MESDVGRLEEIIIKWKTLRDKGKRKDYREETQKRMEMLRSGKEVENKKCDVLS